VDQNQTLSNEDASRRVISVQRILNPVCIAIIDAKVRLVDLGVISPTEIQSLHACQTLLNEVLAVAVINAAALGPSEPSDDGFIGSE
jgi:hypothetical protein